MDFALIKPMWVAPPLAFAAVAIIKIVNSTRIPT
jgi:hypothetical protein